MLLVRVKSENSLAVIFRRDKRFIVLWFWKCLPNRNYQRVVGNRDGDVEFTYDGAGEFFFPMGITEIRNGAKGVAQQMEQRRR